MAFLAHCCGESPFDEEMVRITDRSTMSCGPFESVIRYETASDSDVRSVALTPHQKTGPPPMTYGPIAITDRPFPDELRTDSVRLLPVRLFNKR